MFYLNKQTKYLLKNILWPGLFGKSILWLIACCLWLYYICRNRNNLLPLISYKCKSYCLFAISPIDGVPQSIGMVARHWMTCYCVVSYG